MPSPYPDEVIGSVILRSCRHSGISYKRQIEGLRGPKKTYCSFLLPNNLIVIAKVINTPPEHLLWKHTMFPYIVSYMNWAQILHFQNKVLYSDGNRECLSPLSKSVTHGTPFRRYCSSCVKEDIDRYGETYWRRTHLLPGSHICLKHNTLLMDTPIRLRGQSASNAAMPGDLVGSDYRTSISMGVLTTIAHLNQTAQNFHCAEPYEFRFEALRAGYRRADGNVAGRQVAFDLYTTYTEDFLAETGCRFTLNQRDPWPALLARNCQKGTLSPAKHILLAAFLNTQNIVKNGTIYNKKGKRIHDYLRDDLTLLNMLKNQVRRRSESGYRITVMELIKETGYWSQFRHNRKAYPKTCEFISVFRHSNLSERQIGRRPYWRVRLGLDKR